MAKYGRYWCCNYAWGNKDFIKGQIIYELQTITKGAAEKTDRKREVKALLETLFSDKVQTRRMAFIDVERKLVCRMEHGACSV